MKLLAITIVAGTASAAGAAPKNHLDEILASRASLLAALGDPVAVGSILWDDPACTTLAYSSVEELAGAIDQMLG